MRDDRSLHLPGFPIRRSVDQCVLAAPYRVSSLGTSFFGTSPLGIHQTPFVALEPFGFAGTRPASLHLISPAARGQGQEHGEGDEVPHVCIANRFMALHLPFILVACPKKTHSLALLYFPLFRCKGTWRCPEPMLWSARAVQARLICVRDRAQINSVFRPFSVRRILRSARREASLLQVLRLHLSGLIVYTRFALLSRAILP